MQRSPVLNFIIKLVYQQTIVRAASQKPTLKEAIRLMERTAEISYLHNQP
jgi:hypothetical protein